MNSNHYNFLCCPETGEDLQLAVFSSNTEKPIDSPDFEDVDQGGLYTASGYFYPIIDGIPRMLPLTKELFPQYYLQFQRQINALPLDKRNSERTHYQEFIKYYLPTLKRFGKEWGEHDLEGLTWGLDQETRIQHFLQYMDITKEEMKGKIFLDAGAGTGQLTCSLSKLGSITVGLDLSPSILKGWKQRKVIAPKHYQDLLLVQGNVMQPPFRPQTFDLIHSSGVLHHTPDTKKAFLTVSKLLKNDGRFGVWLYKENGPGFLPVFPFIHSKFLSFNTYTLRKFTPKLPPGILYILIFCYSAFHQCFYFLNSLLRGRKHPQTIKERTTSIFDNLAPPYVYKHHENEVIKWFSDEGYTTMKDTSLDNDSYGFNILGIR